MQIEKISLRENEGRQDVTLTAYVVDDSQEMMAGLRRPAVVICPGGAYLSCSDREGEPVALRFAAMGYHAFVLRYSRYLDEGQDFQDIMGKPPVAKPERAHPAPVQDIALAMKCIHERAGKWLVDTERIAVCGFSAGSHNSAMYAVYWDKPVVTDFVGGAYRPAAAILCYGLSDYTGKSAEDLTQSDPVLGAAANMALFGTAEPDAAARLACSPAHMVSKSTPPTFLWATAADMLVPAGQTLAMAQGLSACRIPYELHVFEEGQHGLSLAMQASAASQQQIDGDVAQWIGLAERWLLRRFALPLPRMTAWEHIMNEGGSPFGDAQQEG